MAVQEFYSLLARHKNGVKVILPVLYQITIKELTNFHLVIADMIAIPSERGIEFVADKLLTEIHLTNETSSSDPIKTNKKTWFFVGIAAIIAVALVALALIYRKPSVSDQFVHTIIEKRIADLNTRAHASLKKLKITVPVQRSSNVVVHEVYAKSLLMKSHYRNEFILYAPGETIRSKKGIEKLLLVDLDTITALNDYSLVKPEIYYARTSDNGKFVDWWVAVNAINPSVSVTSTHLLGERYVVVVHYESPIRMVQGIVRWPNGEHDTRHLTTTLFCLPNSETFIFTKKNNVWELESVNSNL